MGSVARNMQLKSTTMMLVQRALDMNTGDARERIALPGTVPTEPEPEEYYGGASPGGL